MVYKSRIDTWLVLILAGLPLGLLFWIMVLPKDKEGFLSEFESRRKSGST